MAEALQEEVVGATDRTGALGLRDPKDRFPLSSVFADLVPLMSEDLNDQCKKCSENIRSCVKAASVASEIEYTFSSTKLSLIQGILDENRLRLDIWMSDCGVQRDELPRMTTGEANLLPSLLANLFGQIDQSLRSVLRGIKKIEQHSRESVENPSNQPGLVSHINEAERDILDSCDTLRSILVELAELQPSIQTAAAIKLTGPDAGHRADIVRIQTAFQARSRESSREQLPDSALTEETASHKSSEERCLKCNLWIPWNALPLHEDLCTSTNESKAVQHSVTKPRHAQETQPQTSSFPEKARLKSNNPFIASSSSKSETPINPRPKSQKLEERISFEDTRSQSAEERLRRDISISSDLWLEFSRVRFVDRLPFMEVFSHTREIDTRKIQSRLDNIRELRSNPSEELAGLFKGLDNAHSSWTKSRPRIRDGLEPSLLTPQYSREDPMISYKKEFAYIRILELGKELESLIEQKNHSSHTDSIRYIHVPTNNMSWVEAVIDVCLGKDVSDRQATTSERWERQGESAFPAEAWRVRRQRSIVHTRFIKPGCYQNLQHTRHREKSAIISLFIPFLHWETLDKWKMTRRYTQSIRQKRGSEAMGVPKRPGEDLLSLAQHRKTQWLLGKLEHNQSLAYIERRPGNLLGRYLLFAATTYRAMLFSEDATLLHHYLYAEPPLHPRRTLDQYEFRDVPVQIQKDTAKELFMVDQLWMWIIGENTIVTSFSGQAGFANDTGIFAAIRQDIQELSGDGEMHLDVHSLANIIIGQCSGALFNYKHLSEDTPNPPELYSQKLGSLALDLENSKDACQYQQYQYEGTKYEGKNYLEKLDQRFIKCTEAVERIVEELDTMRNIFDEQKRVLTKSHSFNVRHETIQKIEQHRYEISQVYERADKLLKRIMLYHRLQKDALEVHRMTDQTELVKSNSAIKYSTATFTTVSLIFLPLIYLTVAVYLTDGIGLAIILPVSFVVFVLGSQFAFNDDFRAAVSLYITIASLGRPRRKFKPQLEAQESRIRASFQQRERHRNLRKREQMAKRIAAEEQDEEKFLGPRSRGKGKDPEKINTFAV